MGSQGAGGPEMMGGVAFHFAMPLAALLLLGLLVLLLVLFFRRPAKALPAGLAALAPTRGANGGAQAFQSEGQEQECYLVMPDISGYTRFMSQSTFAVGHAQQVISQLLGAMIEAVAGHLSPSKIEGDAILFFGPVPAADRAADADPGGSVLRLLRAFYGKRQELTGSNLCPCAACRHIEKLDLKVFVHRGKVLHYRLGAFTELGGVPVILIHRLLKNSLRLDRYILITNSAGESLRLPVPLVPQPLAEQYDGVGRVEAQVYAFEPKHVMAPDAATASQGPADKTRDLLGKLSANARTLGQALRPKQLPGD